MKPVRIQRKRSKGWKMPENTVYVGRPTIWGNPFRIGGHFRRGGDQSFGHLALACVYVEAFDGYHDSSYTTIATAVEAVEWFRWYASTYTPHKIENIRKELRGKHLACWCPLDQPCHADVLLELANAEVQP